MANRPAGIHGAQMLPSEQPVPAVWTNHATEQLIYGGRAAGWLVVPNLEP